MAGWTIDKIDPERDKGLLEEMDRYVGWHIPDYPFEELLYMAEGGGFVALKNQTRCGMVFAFPYEGRIGWVAYLIVNPKFQRRGIGGLLMKIALDFLRVKGCETIGLYATDQGYPLYKKMKFITDCASYRLKIPNEDYENLLKEGHDPLTAENGNYHHCGLSELQTAEVGKLIELDFKLFGARRERIFYSRCRDKRWRCVLHKKSGKINAFGIYRIMDDGLGFVGPVVDPARLTEQELLRSVFNRLIQQGATALYLGTDKDDIARWMTGLGFNITERPRLMFWPEIPRSKFACTAILHPAKG